MRRNPGPEFSSFQHDSVEQPVAVRLLERAAAVGAGRRVAFRKGRAAGVAAVVGETVRVLHLKGQGKREEMLPVLRFFPLSKGRAPENKHRGMGFDPGARNFLYVNRANGGLGKVSRCRIKPFEELCRGVAGDGNGAPGCLPGDPAPEKV